MLFVTLARKVSERPDVNLAVCGAPFRAFMFPWSHLQCAEQTNYVGLGRPIDRHPPNAFRTSHGDSILQYDSIGITSWFRMDGAGLC